MAIDQITERWSGESAGWASEDSRSGSQQSTRTFDVTVTDTSHDSDYVKANLTDPVTTSLIRNGTSHPGNFYLRCRGVTVTRQSPILFEAVATYKSKSPDEDDPNPLNAPPLISYSTITSEEEIDEDVNGDPINTFNGEPITGVKEVFSDLSMNITKNIEFFDPFSIYLYNNTVNSTTFLGFPAGTARIANIQADQVQDEDFSYWTITVEIQFRKPIVTTNDKAWWKRLRHEGFRVLVGSDIVHATDANGEYVSKPVMLDTDGTEETDPAVAHWLEFQTKRTTDFNSLNLL